MLKFLGVFFVSIGITKIICAFTMAANHKGQ